MSHLTLENIHKSFGGAAVLADVNLELDHGDIGCLLGPSGCGKTTTLRLVAGFETPDGGRLQLAGKTLATSSFTVPAAQRGIGMVFQDYALFPHMCIRDNIGFGLRHLRIPERNRRIHEVLDLVGLRHVERSYAHELSGGQQQRVALARALAPKPHILLLDEPLSSLDEQLRAELGAEIRALVKHLKMTTLLVTHSQEEAFSMADRVGVMNQGHIEQWASPHTVYHHPATPWIGTFVGEGNFISAEMQNGETICTALGAVEPAIHTDCPEQPLVAFFRPEDITLHPQGEASGVVLSSRFAGPFQMLKLRLCASAEEVSCRISSHEAIQPGQEVGLRLLPKRALTFPSGEARSSA